MYRRISVPVLVGYGRIAAHTASIRETGTLARCTPADVCDWRGDPADGGDVSACGGFVLAIQSASELKRYGAIQLFIDIAVVAFTRELGPLLTAIVVSGRSGSAFSAEIGTMVVTEEIDALRTMAIDLVELLLAPKHLGAMVAVPRLTVMSSAFVILAGAGFMFLSRT